MTEPAKQQIEALKFAVEFRVLDSNGYEVEEDSLYEIRKVAKAALTAAPKVGMSDAKRDYLHKIGAIPKKDAAEVEPRGERAGVEGACPTCGANGSKIVDDLRSAEDSARAEMKERCAQLLDKYDGEMAPYYAAAIRALKDEI